MSLPVSPSKFLIQPYVSHIMMSPMNAFSLSKKKIGYHLGVILFWVRTPRNDLLKA